MGCLKRCLLIVVAIHTALLLLAIGFFASAGIWLKASDELTQADIIVVLAGDLERAFFAAEIYRQGFAPMVFVSRPAREHGQNMLDVAGIAMPMGEEVNIQILKHKGVPASRIKIFGTGSLSTVQEAIALRDEVIGKNLRILVVTSPYHVRRSKIIFHNILNENIKELKVIGDPNEPFPTKWWTNQDAARNVMLEVMKLVFYQLGGSFMSYTH